MRLPWVVSARSPPPPFAQGTFPDRAVNMVVLFAPGGTPDIAAPLLAPKMAELVGQTVTVENRAGAVATIGTRAVVQARPDGAYGSDGLNLLPDGADHRGPNAL